MTHHRFNRALALALVSLGFTLGAAAQSTSTQPAAKAKQSAAAPGSMNAVGSGDRKFVEDAAMDGMAEVELARIAQSRAQSDQVKQFAQRMVADHTKAGDELKQLASGKGISVPSSLDKKHQKDIDEMQKKDAAKFDREYMEDMVKDHKKAVSEFEKQSKHAKDSDIRDFASKTLPTLKEHLALAQQVDSAVKGKGGTAKSK